MPQGAMRALLALCFVFLFHFGLSSPGRGDPFTRLDQDHDGYIKLADLFRLHYWHVELSKVYFAEMDLNDDQKLSRFEFVDYRTKWAKQEEIKAKKRCEYLAQKATERHSTLSIHQLEKFFGDENLEWSDGVIPKVLAVFDKNLDQMWSAEELEQFYYFYLPPKRHVENPDETFDRIDQDGDGYIDFDDYIRRDPVYETEIKNMFAKMDDDGNGYVSRFEFDVFDMEQIII